MAAASAEPAGELSLAARLALLPDEQRDEWLASRTRDELARILTDWRFWGRPSQQIPEGEWFLWYIITGRAWGKTRTGSEFCHHEAEVRPRSLGFLAARTAKDARDTLVYHPTSGILATSKPWNPCRYKPSERCVIWQNGSVARLYTSDEPDDGRGPQHEWGVGDEFATWKPKRDSQGYTLLENLLYGLRGGRHGGPRACLTTSPRPTRLVREALEEGRSNADVVLTTGTLYENRSNLPDRFLRYVARRFEGTRLGRQELYGELLEAIEGALWQAESFDPLRVDEAPELKRIVVAVDPAVSSEEGSNRTGIIVCGRGFDDHLYALACRSLVGSPGEWGRRAVDAFYEFEADAVVAEVNQGGDLVEQNVRSLDRNVPLRKVRATRGKAKRAAPVASLYEQSRAHHVGDPRRWAQLEYELTMTDAEDYQGEGSPDDMDALVWGAHELFHLGEGEAPPSMIL